MRFVVSALLAASCGTATPAARKAPSPTPEPRPGTAAQPPASRPEPEPPEEPGSPIDPTPAIKATLDAFAAAVERRDAEAVAAFHVDGPETIAVWPGAGEELVGISAIRKALRQELPTWKSVTFLLTDVRVQVLGPKLAYVWGHYDQDLRARASGARRTVSRRVRGARFFALMTRQPDGWKMLIEAGSIPMTAPMWKTLADPPPYELRPRPR